MVMMVQSENWIKIVKETLIVTCRGVVQLRGPVFRYFRVVPPRWGLLISVLFTIVLMLYKMKNTWFILILHYICMIKHRKLTSPHTKSKPSVTFIFDRGLGVQYVRRHLS